MSNSEAKNLNRTRVVLAHDQVRRIFSLKNQHGCTSLRAASALCARQYGVCAQTIMDIWKGRTWLDTTYDMWDEDERPESKPIGRPKGRKDSRPRTKSVKALSFNRASVQHLNTEEPYSKPSCSKNTTPNRIEYENSDTEILGTDYNDHVREVRLGFREVGSARTPEWPDYAMLCLRELFRGIACQNSGGLPA